MLAAAYYVHVSAIIPEKVRDIVLFSRRLGAGRESVFHTQRVRSPPPASKLIHRSSLTIHVIKANIVGTDSRPVADWAAAGVERNRHLCGWGFLFKLSPARGLHF